MPSRGEVAWPAPVVSSRHRALDFAGGTVVHVNAGMAALVAALVLGPRRDWARLALLPHNVPFVLLGAGLLWFGWFGFDAGSALAFVNTLLAPAATLLVWLPELAARAALSVARAQQRDQHRARQRRLDARPRSPAGGQLWRAVG